MVCLFLRFTDARLSTIKENTKVASNELNAFNKIVEANIKSGRLSSKEGETLVDAANAIINVIK